MGEGAPVPPPDDGLAPESAFPGRVRLSIWGKRAQRKLFRVLDGRSMLFCAFIALPAAALAAAAVGTVVLRAKGDPVDPALLAEAKRLDLDYVTVSAAPHLYVGKPVLWCLIHDRNSRRVVVGGNLSQPVGISGADLPPMDTARMGLCRETLAVVVEGEGLGVNLRYVGRP